jgi:hypothetical protein
MKSKYIQAIAFCCLLGVANSINAQLSPITIGTIHPGDSVVIYYDVTINAGAGSQVSNQGTISGSNFINLVTDDPDSGPLNDATLSFLNVFPLPVTLYEVKAAPKSTGIELSWKVSLESNMVKYEVEKSTNGRNFVKIGEVTALNNTQPGGYTFFDAAPNKGENFYRLRLIDANAAPKYSVIVKVDLSGKHPAIALYPNPVLQNSITLQLNDVCRGSYEVVLYNNAGQTIFVKTIQHDGGSVSRTISLPANLQKGVYSIQFKNEKALHSQLLIIQ